MGTRIKSNAVDRLPNNKHPNMKTSTPSSLPRPARSWPPELAPRAQNTTTTPTTTLASAGTREYVNDYHICYVRDPHACHDAFPSRYYEDEKWIWCPWEEEKHGDWDKWWDKKKDKKHKHGDSHKKKSYKNWFKK